MVAISPSVVLANVVYGEVIVRFISEWLCWPPAKQSQMENNVTQEYNVT
jgi:hypothetical protein